MRKFVLAGLIALVSLCAGALLAPPQVTKTPLGDIRFQVQPALWGGGSLYVPVADWGLRWRLHHAPFVVRSELRSVDRDGLLAAATGEEFLLEASERDIRQGAVQTVFWTILWSTLIAALLGLCFVGMGPWFQAWTAGATLALGGIFLIGALATYSPGELDEPSFYARGVEISQILEAVSSQGENGSYEDNFRKTLGDISSFLAQKPVPKTSRGALLASDLHSNALALPALRDLARNKTLFFVGDFGLEGNDAEASLLAEDIASSARRVLAVSGNHDSSVLMQALAGAGVEVLGRRGVLLPDGRWIDQPVFFQGLRVRAWDDPLEWQGEPGDPDRIYSLSSVTRPSAERDLLAWWKGLRPKPDVLLLHQASLAEFLAGKLQNYPRPLTILVGHDHEQWVAREGNVRIVDAGSVGAGGIFGFGSETAEMAEIYFSEASRSVQAADMIQVSPLDGRASAQRVVLGKICQLPCRYAIRPLPG